VNLQMNKKGFTLVELLVVNNLRQCGLAALNFESSNMHYPTSGGTTATEWENNGLELNAPQFGFENAAWSFQILPFAEQNNLSERRRDLQNNWSLIYEEDITLYTCPSRGGSEKLIGGGTEREFNADYAGVMGTWNDDYVNGGSGVWPSGDTRWDDASTELAFQWQTTQDIIPTEAENVWVGIIIKEAHTRYESGDQGTVMRIGTVTNVVDGTSNTLMFAEKARDARFYTLIAEDAVDGGFWEGGISKPSDWTCMRGFMKKVKSRLSQILEVLILEPPMQFSATDQSMHSVIPPTV